MHITEQCNKQYRDRLWHKTMLITAKKALFFTLIELLIVIAIIAILASLLMPALRKAKETATSTQCIGNQKQILLSFHQWSDDHEGWVPPITWQNKMQEYAIIWDATTGPEPNGILRCPADRGIFWNAPTNNLWLANPYSGYAINFMLNWPFDSPGGSGDGVSPWGTDNAYWGTHGNCKIYAVKQPSTYVYTMDAIDYCNANPADADFLANYRHNKAPNIGWMDGHATRAPSDIRDKKNTGAPRWHSYYPYFYP